MLRSIQLAASAYLRRPLLFVHASLVYAALQLLVLFALLGVLFVGFGISSAINQSPASAPMLLFYAILLAVFSYLSVALHGSLINTCWNCFHGKPASFLEFYRYALDNGFRFFWILLAKVAVELVLFVPLLLLYLFVLQGIASPYVNPVVGLAALAIISLSNLLFFGAFIAAAIYSMPPSTAVKTHWIFLRRRHIFAIALFAIYAAILLTNLVPLLQLVSLFFTYPIALLALTIFFDTHTAREQPPMPAAAAAKGKKPKGGNP